MDEFEEACTILSQHAAAPINKEQIREMGRRIDINNDGNIDFNEFLEAFRIVDKFGREMELERNNSPLLVNGERRGSTKSTSSPTSFDEKIQNA